MLSREMTIVAIHGEGDAATAHNLLRTPKNPTPPMPRPDVVAVLRDDAGNLHEIRMADWDDVKELQQLAGYDTSPNDQKQPKNHWKFGAKVKVTVGAIEAPAA
jgi:hypothetical protein